jgi:hypothetical protein
METFTIIIAAAVPSILSGSALIIINKWNHKSERREDARRKENILLLKNVDAVGCLAEQTARCFRGEKPNGDLTAALEYRKKQKHALEDHLMEVNADI